MAAPRISTADVKGISPLTGSDSYAMWSSRMRGMLRGKVLWAAVDGPDAIQRQAGETNTQWTNRQRQWNEDQSWAFQAIMFAVDDTMGTHVLPYESTPGEGTKAWTELKENCEPDSAASAHALVSELSHTYYDRDLGLSPYITKSKAIQTRLAGLRTPVLDDLLASHIANGLPIAFQAAVQSYLGANPAVRLSSFVAAPRAAEPRMKSATPRRTSHANVSKTTANTNDSAP
ncbi:hypothetical protein Dda_7011 [Drechslerella dactyloides]|uniref:DUF4219 domain-containing protein n=1 Tax=Drechslerella dactyloides TaxID=74499 RepID=A0AAD6ITI4_DREDA|nr:hypothetical protein Dda_7011 [Drechslerella dactyloides]